MSFLNRLFSRKAKTPAVAHTHSLRRSLTDPAAAASGVSPTSSEGEAEGFGASTSAPVPARRARRAGCDLTRAKTSLEIQMHGMLSNRVSSNGDSGAAQEDPVKSQYRSLLPVHTSRLNTIVAAQDRQSKQQVMLKVYRRSKMSSVAKVRLDSEVSNLKLLSGAPGVAKFLNYVEDAEACYVVMERCPGHTLIEVISNSGGRLQEAALVVDVLIPLLHCLAALHAHGVVHRQVKPEHVMVSKAAVHLLDFSEAANKALCCLNNRAGALEYMAPEVLGKPSAEEVFHQVLYNGMSEEELPQYDEKADIWSLGVVIYETLTGCQPLLADGVEDMMRAQDAMMRDVDEEGTPRILLGRGLSPEAIDFLRQVLQFQPSVRPSAEQLLAHPLVVRHWPAFSAKQLQLSASRQASFDVGEERLRLRKQAVVNCAAVQPMAAAGVSALPSLASSAPWMAPAAAAVPVALTFPIR